jgi:manganese/zinc/iron transport system substrate-binding protein
MVSLSPRKNRLVCKTWIHSFRYGQLTMTSETKRKLEIRPNRVCLGLLRCLFCFAVLGCQGSIEKPTSSKKLKVVATTGMVADLVRQIGGEHVEVEQLMKSGVDPHLYKANTDDVIAIKRADVVFYNGFKLEGKMSDLLDLDNDAPRNAGKTHIALVDAIPKEAALFDTDHDKKSAGANQKMVEDPHIWMDVMLWYEATKLIEEELKRRLPEHAALFAECANNLRDRLEKLDALGKRWIESIPAEQRILITSHDAFKYFGRRYGLQVEGIQGVSTSSEAGLRHVEDLVNLLVDKKVPAVFVESSVPQKSILSIIEGAAAKGVKVSVGGELYSDAMGPKGSGADTYEGMMEHNLKTITKALGGNPVK